MVINTTFRIAIAVVVYASFPQSGFARDPHSRLDELLEKSDVVVLAKVTQFTKSSRYSDLDARGFDEFSVEVEVRSLFKGELKRGAKITVVAYKSTGKGGPGNFGSTLRLFGEDKRAFHLLYLRKRDDTWMPTSGYIDGGNSHFVVQPSGFVE